MKVGQVLDAGAIPCGDWTEFSLRVSYAIAKPIAERTDGAVGCVSLDTHWDIQPIDFLSQDPRIAGSASWKHKMYEFHENMHPQHLVEIGERGYAREERPCRVLHRPRRKVHLFLGSAGRVGHEGCGPRAGPCLQRHKSRSTSISTWT